MAFDECGNIRTAGNNPPTSLTRLVQRGTDKICRDTSTGECFWDKHVIEYDAVALKNVAEERDGLVTCASFETLSGRVVRHVRRRGAKVGRGDWPAGTPIIPAEL